MRACKVQTAKLTLYKHYKSTNLDDMSYINPSIIYTVLTKGCNLWYQLPEDIKNI